MKSGKTPDLQKYQFHGRLNHTLLPTRDEVSTVEDRPRSATFLTCSRESGKSSRG